MDSIRPSVAERDEQVARDLIARIRANHTTPAAFSYWIDADGAIRDLEAHADVVLFQLARDIANHNREMKTRP